VNREDTRSVVIKKNPKNIKFKARTGRFLITLVVKDAAKAEKLIKMLPEKVKPTVIN
jgi:transposase-like protein